MSEAEPHLERKVGFEMVEILVNKYLKGSKWLCERYGKICWLEYRRLEERFVNIVKRPLYLELDKLGMRHDDFEAWVEVETGLETSGVILTEIDLKEVWN